MKEALHLGVVVAGVTAHQNDRPVGLDTEITYVEEGAKAKRSISRSSTASGTCGSSGYTRNSQSSSPAGSPRCLITTTTTFARFRALRTRRDDPRLQPVSDRGLAIFIAALTAALVLGYLFVNKLADMSSEEDCALAHRKNCGAVELSR